MTCDVRITSAVLALLLMAGCRSSEQGHQGTTEPARPPRGFTVVWDEPVSLDPALVDDAHASNIVCQVFDGLLAVDEKLNLVPELARSWRISEDGRTYVFELVPNATFHNGRAITAEDFVYSFKRLLEPGMRERGIGAEYLKDVSGAEDYAAGRATEIRGLKAIDRIHFSIELRTPDTTLLAAMTMPNFKVVPREAIGPDFGKRPVGSGPFVFEEWRPGNEIRLRANRSYYAKGPEIDEVQFRVRGDMSTRETLEMFRRGRVQMIEAVGEDASFLAKEGYQVVKHSELSVHYLGFNCAMQPFNDVRVRRAVASAIKYDRFGMTEPLNYIPASGIIPPGMSGYKPRDRPYRYDPVAAVQLLKAAGYQNGFMNTSVDFFSYTGDVGLGTMTENSIAEDLLKIGLRLHRSPLPWAEFDQALTDKRLPVFRLAWIADVPDTSSVLYSLFYSRALNNFFAYSNAEVDHLLLRAHAELDPEMKSMLYADAEARILQDVPMIPLDFGCYIYALQPYVRGLALSPYGLADIPLERVHYSR